MKRLVPVLAVVLLVALGGCSRPASESPEVSAVESAIRSYNARLADAFEAHDMNALNTVATRDQAYTEFYQMAALGESGVTLESTLTAIAFKSVTFSGEASATAETVETWEYRHVSNDTSETVRTESGTEYSLRYELVLQEGRWLVDRVTSLDSTGTSEETTP